MSPTEDQTTKVQPAADEIARPSPILALTLIAHRDPNRIGERYFFPKNTQIVRVSRKEPEFFSENQAPRPIDDAYISRTPIFLQCDDRGRVCIDPNGRSGVVAAGVAVTEPRWFPAAEIKGGITLTLTNRVGLLLHQIMPDNLDVPDLGLVGQSNGINRIRKEILRVADMDIPVLIRGESGTGKELVARALHQASHRKHREMVSVNMGALAPNLAAGELLGSVRGAYTGAAGDRPGYLRAANGGTLFLDEIGEASPETQVLLMRVLETRQVFPVGSQKGFEVDLRLITATDANLEKMIGQGTFKAPLLHRLSAYEIWTPPLRHRRDDIMRLFVYFAGQISQKTKADADQTNPWLPANLAARLVHYHWPGNVRQLRNIAHQLVIDNEGRPQLEISPRIARTLQAEPDMLPAPATTRSTPQKRRKPSDVTAEELLKAMTAANWEPSAAARALGISRASIYDLVRKHNAIKMVEDLPDDQITACFQDHDGDLEATAAHLKVSLNGLRRRINRMGLS